MHYAIIVLLTFIQTLVMNRMMGLSVFEASPYTIRIWCNYLAASLVLWSPMLLTNKKRWTYAVAVLLDVWLIGNLIYFRSYSDVLNRWCLQNAGNMQGIWSSILPFLQWRDLFFPIVTVGWIVFCETDQRAYKLSIWKRISIFLVAFLLCCTPQTLIHKKADLPLSPFDTYYADVSMGRMWYIYTFGAITHLGNEILNMVTRKQTELVPVVNEETTVFMQKPDSVPNQGNLLIVFFESLEDWTIGLHVDGQAITPNLNRLTAHPMTGHYPMKAQVKEGKSSDAQLIVFNGLLPLRNGAASMRYAYNKYPSLVTYMDASTKHMFAAYAYHMWNQKMNAEAYGFDSLYAVEMSDIELANRTIHTIRHAPRPFMVATVTMASHSPFMAYADSSALRIASHDYTRTQAHYLQCVHYTDSAVGRILDAVMTDSLLAATTRIVIIGDHPIFDVDTSVPFIIYDPFGLPVTITRPLYQMDIYTTLVERMHIATLWHGLGKNIADTCAYTPEQMKALESLSDRLIRSNYFDSSL